MPLPSYIPWQVEALDERRRAARRVRRQPVGLLALGMAIGIVADRFTTTPLAAWWIAALLLVVAWRCWFRGRVGGTTTLVLATAAVAGAWHHLNWHYFADDDLGRYATELRRPVAIEVVALASPTRVLPAQPTPYRAIPATDQSRLLVDCRKVRNGADWQAASGRARLAVDGLVENVNRGDRLLVFAQFARPRPAGNDGGFDYALHLRGERQLVTLVTRSPSCVTKIDDGNWWSPLRQIDRLRSRWSTQLWEQLPDRSAAMATALLLGAEGALPREDTVEFRTTGTTHVLVVSGLHTSIVISLLYVAVRLGWLSTWRGAAAAIVLAGFFAVLTGMNPPVIRAAMLVILASLATVWGQRVLAHNSLAVALVIVLALSPAELFRTGTQLSFLCVVTLIAYGEWVLAQPRRDPLDQLALEADPAWWRWGRSGASYAWNVALASGCVWLASLPLLLHAYNVATPIAVVISPLLFALLTVTLMSGFLTLVLGLVSFSLAGVFASLSQMCISTLDGLVQWSHTAPLSHTWSVGPATWWVVGSYLLAGLLWNLAPELWRGHRWIRWAAIWIVIGTLPAIVSSLRTDRPLVCHMVDVGHGVCVAVESPDGRLVLYDAGSLGSPYAATETISRFLWQRGHRRIDAIILSHADVDHFNAVPGLLDRFEVAAVYVSPHMFRAIESPDLAAAPASLQKLLADRDVPARVLELGDRLTIDAVTTAEVLHPGLLDLAGRDNSRSLVLGIEFAGHRILLPGDLESPGIDAVMADEPYDCDILLAPHHGSAGSNPPGFAQWSTPEWVVISGSRDVARESAVGSYRDRGATVLDTSLGGCVTFAIDSQGITASTFRN